MHKYHVGVSETWRNVRNAAKLVCFSRERGFRDVPRITQSNLTLYSFTCRHTKPWIENTLPLSEGVVYLDSPVPGRQAAHCGFPISNGSRRDYTNATNVSQSNHVMRQKLLPQGLHKYDKYGSYTKNYSHMEYTMWQIWLPQWYKLENIGRLSAPAATAIVILTSHTKCVTSYFRKYPKLLHKTWFVWKSLTYATKHVTIFKQSNSSRR